MYISGKGCYTVFLFLTLVFVALSTFVPGQFTTESQAVTAMESAGYTNVEVTQKSVFLVGLFGCDRSDAAKYDVTAVNPIGQPVTNTYVCVGWPLKGSTIRSE